MPLTAALVCPGFNHMCLGHSREHGAAILEQLMVVAKEWTLPSLFASVDHCYSGSRQFLKRSARLSLCCLLFD